MDLTCIQRLLLLLIILCLSSSHHWFWELSLRKQKSLDSEVKELLKEIFYLLLNFSLKSRLCSWLCQEPITLLVVYVYIVLKPETTKRNHRSETIETKRPKRAKMKKVIKHGRDLCHVNIVVANGTSKNVGLAKFKFGRISKSPKRFWQVSKSRFCMVSFLLF